MLFSRIQIFMLGLMTITLVPLTTLALEPQLPTDAGEQQAWIVNDYRYEQGSPQDDPDMGLYLCGTRCNAMTSDYRNVIDPGGWELIRVAENKELIVELNNKLIGGHCICIADEYIVKVSEFNRPEKSN